MLERKRLAGSIWCQFLTLLRINLILWHLITFPISDNQNQCDGLHILAGTYMNTHMW